MFRSNIQNVFQLQEVQETFLHIPASWDIFKTVRRRRSSHNLENNCILLDNHPVCCK